MKHPIIKRLFKMFLKLNTKINYLKEFKILMKVDLKGLRVV